MIKEINNANGDIWNKTIDLQIALKDLQLIRDALWEVSWNILPKRQLDNSDEYIYDIDYFDDVCDEIDKLCERYRLYSFNN